MSQPEAVAPQNGPQRRFLETAADVAIFGGAAGGGKSYALLMEAARWHRVKGFSAVIFRRTYPELTGGGSIWEKARAMFAGLAGALGRELPHLDWRFGSGGVIEFRHLQHQKDVERHQGKEYCLVEFDELTHFEEEQFWYLLSRNRSTCGVRPYIRASTNPDSESWVRDFIDWWIDEEGYPIPERSGVLRWFLRIDEDLVWASTREELLRDYPDLDPKSATFIGAKLEDNPALMKVDPGYRGRLQVLQRVERERLLGGNWNVRAEAGSFFRRGWFGVVDELPDGTYSRVRAWDLAATPKKAGNDPDWTVGVLMARDRDGATFVEHVERDRLGPGGVENLLLSTARHDGAATVVALWQDPGQAGKAQAEHLTALLEDEGFTVEVMVAAKKKTDYAKPLSAAVEPGEDEIHGDLAIVRAQWNGPYLACMAAFPEGKHDDDVDASSRAWIALPDVGTKFAPLSPSGKERGAARSSRGRKRRAGSKLRGRWGGV